MLALQHSTGSRFDDCLIVHENTVSFEVLAAETPHS